MEENIFAHKCLAASKEQFMEGVRHRNPHEPEFHQAVHEIVESVMEYYLSREDLRNAQVLERLTEPDRIVSFRVVWEDDLGRIRANRAWRVQFNHALGPYKGGLRFHKTVNQSILKFLGFEQVFKNALTKLPLGGAKGGANFNPRGKSDREIMRFCHSLMIELHRHIGPDIDVPAGDIGVGGREISYMFAQYLRLQNRWHGVLTGKGATYGGSLIRAEATGYGCVFFCREMLATNGESLKDKSVAISGSGNVALYAAEQVLKEGGRVISLSDSEGTLEASSGLTSDQLEKIKKLKFGERGRLKSLIEEDKSLSFHAGKKPWGMKCDIALPCATQNEIGKEEAESLVREGVRFVCEGANMPTDAHAIAVFRANKVMHAPGKASNAGGVAVSGLEMTQNSIRQYWSAEKVEAELAAIMESIHSQCVEFGKQKDFINYVDGANLASFHRISDVMLSYGLI